MDSSNFTEIQSTERSLQLAVESKAVGLNQEVNEQQPKGLFRRFKTWVGRGFRPKRRHQTDGQTIEKQINHLNEVPEYRPVGPNTFAESCVGSDSIRDSKARERKLKRLLKDKKFVKVKSDGDRRYVRKAIDRTSFWSRIRRLFSRKVPEHYQLRVRSRPILKAQNGREDDNKCEVHKNICDQQKGRKRVVRPVVCDIPLRTVGLVVREEVNKLPIKGRVPIDGRSKRSSAEVFFFRHKALKESFNRIPYDRECARIGGMDDSIVGPPIKKPLTEELRMSMCQTVRHCLPLLKSRDIKVYQSIARGGQGLIFYGERRVDNESRQIAIKVNLSKDHDFFDELAVMRKL